MRPIREAASNLTRRRVTAKEEVSPELKQAIANSLDAHAGGDSRLFDFLEDDVRVFNVNDPAPMIGRREFENSFAENLGRHREVRVRRSAR